MIDLPDCFEYFLSIPKYEHYINITKVNVSLFP